MDNDLWNMSLLIQEFYHVRERISRLLYDKFSEEPLINLEYTMLLGVIRKLWRN